MTVVTASYAMSSDLRWVFVVQVGHINHGDVEAVKFITAKIGLGCVERGK